MAEQIKESSNQAPEQMDSESFENIPKQTQIIWKHTKYDGQLPITNFVMGVQEANPNKLMNEKKVGSDQMTKITTFENRKPVESIIKHQKLITKQPAAADPTIKQEEEISKQEEGDLSDGEEQEEEMEEVEDLPEPSLKVDQNVPEIGTYIYLTNLKQYSFVKSKIEGHIYLCVLNDFEQEMFLHPLGDPDASHNEEATIWQNTINLKIRAILAEGKTQTVQYKLKTNDKAMAFAEQIADLYNETKYSISFFYKGAKINLNSSIASLGIGYVENSNQQGSTVLCLKGGVDQPKVFNRFTNVDSPERQLSYISEEEAYDAISFIPNKDIKLAGFSVYYVTQPLDFRCIYKLKIGTDHSPEKTIELAQGDVENKMCDIMFPEEIIIQKDKQFSIGVRFIAGDDFFCSTLLGYGGENFRNNHMNEECAFEVLDSNECTKGETDHTFGQVPRLMYFDVNK